MAIGASDVVGTNPLDNSVDPILFTALMGSCTLRNHFPVAIPQQNLTEVKRLPFLKNLELCENDNHGNI